MQARFTLAVLLGVVLLAAAACSSGGDDERIAELETDLEASEEATKKAQEEAAEAAKKAEAAAVARKKAEDDAAAAKKKADDDAAAAKKKADDDAAEAERLRLEAEAARLAAEAERARLAAAAEERRKADAAERARTAIAGDWMVGNADPGVLDVEDDDDDIKHGAPVVVTLPPGPFTTSTGRSGVWSTTSLTAIAEPTRDMIEIYSDVEAPKRSAFSTSPLNEGADVSPSGGKVIDGTENVVGWVNIMNAVGGDDGHSRIAAAGAFPRVIGNAEPFKLLDEGLDKLTYTVLGLDAEGLATDEQLANVATHGITRQQYNQYRADRGFRDPDEFPDRYAYTTRGTLQGASGTYRCSGDNPATDTCTVQNRGGSFEFAGNNADWDFIPSIGTVQIVVPDAEYMWFGVWARQTVRLGGMTPDQPTETWAFEANHGGNEAGSVTLATGTATYRGPAVGRYAVYEPDTGDSGIGSFTASATLEADFDATGDEDTEGTVAGMITGFSNDPSWELALKRGNINSAKVAVGSDADDPGVTWTIDGVPDDSGAWEAAFYANLPVTGGAIDYQPHGIAGTFEAQYNASGVGPTAAVIGAFGAHR